MDEADALATAIRARDPSEKRIIHITRWAIVADEVMALTIQAEEVLPEQALHDLRIRVNTNQPERWFVYRTGVAMLKRSPARNCGNIQLLPLHSVSYSMRHQMNKG